MYGGRISSGRRCSWVSSVFGILVVGKFRSWQPRSLAWRIAWLNMIGSVLFMASALGAYVLPGSGDVVAVRIVVAGTFFGAACFLIGAALMFPAWRRAVQQRHVSALRGVLPDGQDRRGPGH